MENRVSSKNSERTRPSSCVRVFASNSFNVNMNSANKKPGFLSLTPVPRNIHSSRVYSNETPATNLVRSNQYEPAKAKENNLAIRVYSSPQNHATGCKTRPTSKLDCLAQSENDSSKSMAKDLQVAACSIRNILQISQRADRLNLFEIFGVVCSTPARHPRFDVKEFDLKDGNDLIRCIYYDDVGTKILHGLRYRCVGHLSCQDRSKLHCISVRLMTDIEKKIASELLGRSSLLFQSL